MTAQGKSLMTAIARDVVALVHSFPLGASLRPDPSGKDVAISGRDSVRFIDVLVDLYTPSGLDANPVISPSDRGQWEDMERIGQDFKRAIETVQIEHAA